MAVGWVWACYYVLWFRSFDGTMIPGSEEGERRALVMMTIVAVNSS